MTPGKTYEIRCPLHGFVELDEWERDIIEIPAFQRLRRIRQLAWTDQVYPGAMHTRFEHSLGVMDVATRMYDAVVESSGDVLRDLFGYNDTGFERHRVQVRLAALLHDVGHAPFSHAGEDLLPFRTEKSRYTHEQYSAAIIREKFRDVIEDHPKNKNYAVKADDIAGLIEGTSKPGEGLFWREIISGQIDADRMDYLRRDSLHCGVDYGKFDWHRLLRTIVVVEDPEDSSPRLGVEEGGIHAAEAMILARYFMFTQIYFHKTRMAFNHHLHKALHELLPGGVFPKPARKDLDRYLKWDDWKVLGRLGQNKGGEHGKRLVARDHYREVYHTPEQPQKADLALLETISEALGNAVLAREEASKSWYKKKSTDIPILEKVGRVRPLSSHSSVVGKLDQNQQVRLFADRNGSSGLRDTVRTIIEENKREEHD